MTEKEINIYLEAFWKGESTQEQEEALKRFFASKTIPTPFEQDRPYFDYLKQEQKKELVNPNFDNQVREEIQRKKIRNLWYGAVKIAAGIALFGVAAWWYHTHQMSVPNAGASFEEKSIPLLLHKSDSQKSQKLAKDALLLLSKGLSQDSTHEENLYEFKIQLQDYPKGKPAIDIIQ